MESLHISLEAEICSSEVGWLQKIELTLSKRSSSEAKGNPKYQKWGPEPRNVIKAWQRVWRMLGSAVQVRSKAGESLSIWTKHQALPDWTDDESLLSSSGVTIRLFPPEEMPRMEWSEVALYSLENHLIENLLCIRISTLPIYINPL